MIKLSGFGHFEKLLHTFLSQNNVGKTIRIDNLMFEFRKLPRLAFMVESQPGDVEMIANVCELMFKIINVIMKIDAEKGANMIQHALSEITESLKDYLSGYLGNSHITYAEHVIRKYDQFRDLIFIPYFKDYMESSYPSWIKNIILGIVKKQLSENRFQTMMLMQSYKICQTVGAIETLEDFENIVNTILQNENGFSTIIMSSEIGIDNSNVLEFVAIGESLGINMNIFLRFVLLNRICDKQISSDERFFQKQMIYLKYGEIPIYTYLQQVNSTRHISPEWVMNGLTAKILEDPVHELDIEYLVRECSKK